MSAQSVEGRLRAVLGAWPDPIAPETERKLIDLIRTASGRVADDRLDSDAEKLREAETNLRRILVEMTRQAGALGVNQLQDQALIKALAAICPLWPFC